MPESVFLLEQRFWIQKMIWVWTSYTSLKSRVVLCRIRIFPTKISKMKWVWSGLPLNTFFRNILIASKNSKIWHLFSIRLEFSAKNENVLLKEGVPFWHFYLVSLLKCCYASLSLPFQPFFLKVFSSETPQKIQFMPSHKQYYLERLTTGQILFWRSSA